MASINGVDIYYEVGGPPDGDWIAFAHGGEGTHLHWWQQVAALRSSFQCLTYDARGFGMSGGEPGGGGSTPAQDLLGPLDHVGVDRALLVGQSMGGWAVSGVAQAHPDRAAGLVMGDTPFGFSTAALSKWAAEMLHKIPDGFDVLENLFAPDFPREQPEMHYLYQALNRLN